MVTELAAGIQQIRIQNTWSTDLMARKGEPGKTYTFAAGIIEDVFGFDPTVFSISPREAEQMARAADDSRRVLAEAFHYRYHPLAARLKAILDSGDELVTRVVRERVEKGELASAPLPVVEPSMSEETTEAAAETPSANAQAIGPITSRVEAYRALATAAEFLMRTEPHSPVPYLVRRAIHWGNLSLVELLDELLQKNADVNTVYALLGMKRPG